MNKSKLIDFNDFEAKRFALNYSPPKIIIEYEAPSKKKLYLYKINLTNLKSDSNIEEIMKEIYIKHNSLFDLKKVEEFQIINLIEKLKENLSGTSSLLDNEDD